jgi:hypothetical protein
VVHGFHPSIYLREDYVVEKKWSPQHVNTARDVLRFCVAQALAFLEDEYNLLEEDDLFKSWRTLVSPRQQFSTKEDDAVDSLAEELEALGM